MIRKVKKNLKSKLGFIFLSSLMIFALARVYYRATDDFRLSNMTHEMPHHKEWEIEPLSLSEDLHLNKILEQTFTYLGKGAQSYVFSSSDGQYVIKFFKFKHIRPSFFLNALPSVFPFASYKEREIARKERKLLGVFNGYHLAYEIHKEESGLVYIHLNKTAHFNRAVHVIDKIGRSFEIDLDKNVFLIQKKGETLLSTLSKLLKKQEIPLAKKRIRQIFDLYLSEYKKGVYDLDDGVLYNTGFVGENPIHLDVGKFMREGKEKGILEKKGDLKLMTQKISRWVEKNYPSQYEEIAKDIEDKFLEITL